MCPSVISPLAEVSYLAIKVLDEASVSLPIDEPDDANGAVWSNCVGFRVAVPLSAIHSAVAALTEQICPKFPALLPMGNYRSRGTQVTNRRGVFLMKGPETPIFMSKPMPTKSSRMGWSICPNHRW